MPKKVKWSLDSDGFVRFRRVRRELFVGSLTQTGGTATCVAESHGLTTGDKVTFSDWDDDSYNGDFTVTVTNANTFTFAVSSSADSPAESNGTPHAGSAQAFVNSGTATATINPDVGAGTISGDYKTSSDGMWVFPIDDTLTFEEGKIYTLTAIITATSGEKYTATIRGTAVTVPDA